MKRILKYFVQGLISVVPVTVTIYLIYKSFEIIDNLLPFSIPGLGLLIIIVGVTLVGFVVNHLVSDRLLGLFDRILRRTPLISLIYTAVKDLMEAFVGQKRSFSRPVMVRFNEDSEVRRLGFITNDNFSQRPEGIDLVTVYIPHSYNISGNTFLVPARFIQPIETNSSEFMKYAVSGGVTELAEMSILPPLNENP